MSRLGRSTRRVIVFAVGMLVLLAGVALLVLPGPGILLILLGLAILAAEFAWARHALHKARAGLRRVRRGRGDRQG